jgi:Spy/CpxP family protein refolding chaperone
MPEATEGKTGRQETSLMKRGRCLLFAGLSVLLASGVARAAPGDAPAGAQTGPASKAPAALRGEWAILAAELQLTDDQKAKLLSRLTAYAEASAGWDKQYGEKMKAAREAKDANAVRALTQSQENLAADRDADVQALLTADQKVKWEGFKLYRAEMLALRRANPSDDQKAKVRDLCDAAGKEFAGLKAEKDLQAARAKLRQAALDVLTPEQQETLKRASASQPAARGAAGPG